MSRAFEYYEKMKSLARQKRDLYSIGQKIIGLSDIRRIYKTEGIKIYLADGRSKNLRAAYYNDNDGCDVYLNGRLPKEARIFSLIHELKHHYEDRARLQTTVPCCLKYGQEPEIEISAEIFAAEFIWPEQEFRQAVQGYGITSANCCPERVVHFKRTFTMPVSYTFIVKRLEWFGIIPKGKFNKVKFKNLEYLIYGKPFFLRYSRR